MKLSTSGVYSFFLLILCFSVFFVLKPPRKEIIQEHYEGEVATLEVEDFVFYLIENQKLEVLIQGEKARQYKNREEFDDFLITRYNQGLKIRGVPKGAEYFYVTRGVKKGDMYEFYDGVFYHQDRGYSFGIRQGVYDYAKMVFWGKGEFLLKDQKGEFSGENLYYNANTNLINADHPRGKIWLNK